MAKTKQVQQRKLELLQELQQQRNLLTGSHLLLRDQLNVSKKLQGSIKEHPKRWFQGGIVAGLGATFLLKRPKKKKVTVVAAPSSTIQQILFKYAFSAIKPILTELITKQVRNYVDKQQRQTPPKS